MPGPMDDWPRLPIAITVFFITGSFIIIIPMVVMDAPDYYE